jgi:hypothetical protein
MCPSLGIHHRFEVPPDVMRQPANALDKPVLDQPVLDQGTFQQLLNAAYTLQEQNDLLRMTRAMADSSQTASDGAVAGKLHLISTVSTTLGPLANTEPPLKSVFPMAQSDGEPLAPRDDSLLHPETDPRVPDGATEILETASFRRAQSKLAHLTLGVRHPVPSATIASRRRTVRRRISQSNELFWKAATLVGMAAVWALLLGASIDRFSPLPAGLALPSEVQQPVPFRSAKRIVTVLAHSGGVRTKTIGMEPQATTNTGPAEQKVAPDSTPGRNATSPPARKKIRNRTHSAYASEADVVARDTVVRYGPRSAAPVAQAQK